MCCAVGANRWRGHTGVIPLRVHQLNKSVTAGDLLCLLITEAKGSTGKRLNRWLEVTYRCCLHSSGFPNLYISSHFLCMSHINYLQRYLHCMLLLSSGDVQYWWVWDLRSPQSGSCSMLRLIRATNAVLHSFSGLNYIIVLNVCVREATNYSSFKCLNFSKAIVLKKYF